MKLQLAFRMLTSGILHCLKMFGVLWTKFPVSILILQPDVSDQTGALLVYSCFITYKSFSHRPTSELLGTCM